MVLPPSAVDLIESGAHGHLVTINSDGSAQVSMVWSTVEDGEVCVASLTPRRKLDNVRRDARVVISYEARQRDANQGLNYYLTVAGIARVTLGGAPALLSRIAPRYLDPSTRFPRGDNPPEGWIMRVRPTRVGGYGPWASNG